MRRGRIVSVLVVGALALVGCGDEDSGGDDGSSGDGGGGTAATGSAATETTLSGELPDPCMLVDQATLTDLVGSDPGEGSMTAPVPEERKVCMYPGGFILAVEVASHYDASVEIIRDNPSGATISDLDGVGTEAIWVDNGGGRGQVVAQSDPYFVGVSVSAGGVESAKAIALAMLDP